MKFLQTMFLWVGLFCALLVVIGFVQPTLLLWWEDTQNRIRIFKVYGTATFILLILYLISLLFI